MKTSKTSNSIDAFRILIVEDEPAWQEALQILYRNWFPAVQITVYDNDQQARRLLRKGETDLVSLDLNLSHSPDGGKELHGMGLLVNLSKNRWARAVCVITQANVDQHLRYYFRDPRHSNMLERLKMCPNHTLNRFLGMQGMVIHKQVEKTPQENIALFLKSIKSQDIKECLCTFSLSFSGDGYHQALCATVSGGHGLEMEEVSFQGKDAEFLEKLAKARTNPEVVNQLRVNWITDHEVADLYDIPKTLKGSGKYTPVHTIKRRLRKGGLTGMELLLRVKATNEHAPQDAWSLPGGWRLNPLVTIKNLAAKKEFQLGEKVAWLSAPHEDDTH